MYTPRNTSHVHTCPPLPVPATTLIFLLITSPRHPTPLPSTDAIPHLVLRVPAHMAPPLKGLPEAGLSRPLVRFLIASCPLHSLNHMAYNTDILKAEVILFIPTCHQASAVLGFWQGWNTLFGIGQMDCPGSPGKSSAKLRLEPMPLNPGVFSFP